MLTEYSVQRAEALNQLNISEIEMPISIKFLWFDIVTASNITKRIYTGVHSHSFFELQFVFSGRVNYECNGVNVELKKGDALFIPADMSHKYLGCDAELIKGSIAFSFDNHSFFNKDDFHKFIFSFDVANNTNFVLKQIENADTFTPCIVCGRMLEILHSVCNSINILIPKSVIPESDSRLTFAQKYIDANKNRIISCEDVAKACGLSSKQLSRIFKSNLDCSLFEYIIDARIRYAKKLLNNSKYSIKEVGYMLGFENESSFVSFFKRNCNVPPGMYRKGKMSEN